MAYKGYFILCVLLSQNLVWPHYFIQMQQTMVRIRLYKHRVLLHNLYNDDDDGTANIWE